MNAPGRPSMCSAEAGFAPALARLDRLIEREILRLRARYELSLDELRGLYVSDAQVDALLASRHASGPAPAPATAWGGADLDDLPVGNEPQLVAVAPRWQALCGALALTPLEQDMLLLVLAPELHARYETLYAYLNNDLARRHVSAELAMRLLGPDSSVALRASLAPDAQLAASGVLLPAGAGDTPRAQRGWRLAPPLSDWLLGLAWSDERLPPAVYSAWRSDGGGRGVDDPGVARSLRPRGSRLAAAVDASLARQRALVAVVSAATADDAQYVAHRVLEQAGCQLLQLDLRALRTLPAPAEAVTALQLQARVTGRAVLVAPLDALAEPDGRLNEPLLTALRRLGAALPCLYASGPGRWREAVLALGLREAALSEQDDDAADGVFELGVPELNGEERAELWRSELAGLDFDAQALADRFVLGPVRIRRAARRALELLRDGAAAGLQAACFAAARALSTEDAADVTRAVESTLRWDDLVLPAPVAARLREVLRAIELRPRVLDDWGLARRLNGGRAINVMLAGVSGTGKTMAAGLVARSVGMDLHRLELAAVVSKYIGETEKNLDRAFDAARRANAILFIDEADALLGKRSEVKDAHDRHANVEIAYLLQKMEDHDGVVIIATNLAGNLDEAFSRRMQFVIDFPLPDAGGRERLWRGMLPTALPLAGDIDFAFLARQFALAGGDIRNVVLDAAYAAAADAAPLSMRHLLQAVARQQAKRGRAMDRAQLREYAHLLEAG
jgi:AAA+ superfamily predicted ATPase